MHMSLIVLVRDRSDTRHGLAAADREEMIATANQSPSAFLQLENRFLSYVELGSTGSWYLTEGSPAGRGNCLRRLTWYLA